MQIVNAAADLTPRGGLRPLDFPTLFALLSRTGLRVSEAFLLGQTWAERAAIRHRHRTTKGSGSRKACLAMVFKLVQAAERKWRRLNGAKHILHLLAGYKFEDGIIQERAA